MIEADSIELTPPAGDLPAPGPHTTPADWARRLGVPEWKASAVIAGTGWHPWAEVSEADYRSAIRTLDELRLG